MKLFALLACALVPMAHSASHQDPIDIAFQKFELENGLQVVIHEDHTNPVVAVFVSYHVGSAREEVGRSGFAHLFEHMLFQGSQHVGDDQHFKLISEAGGSLNGTTNQDRTLYFETLPSNQLELALWLEADRMGFLLPAMSQEKLDNQRDVVKNERRQNYENRPYGRISEVVARTLYPADHPYSWVTIGSMADLSAASLEDVHAFFRRWYGPNNATLAIGGDVDTEAALALARKYFGSIPRGPEVGAMLPRPANLERTKRAVLEDRVNLPQLNLVWPTAPQYTADEAALNLLAMVLSENKSSILDKALTVDEVLVNQITAYNSSSELAGEFTILARAAPGVSLTELETRLFELLEQLGADGVDPAQLQRMKNRRETRFYGRMETVSGRTGSMAVANMFLGNPTHAVLELQRELAVTPEQVADVLERYLLDKPCVIVSTVPEGCIELASSGRTRAQAAEELALDRRAKPDPGPRPQVKTPPLWHDSFPAGLAVTGTRFAEIPMTTLALSVPGGRKYESLDKLGVSSLTAEMMNEGTATLSTTELTDAIDFLGASLSVSADDDEITIRLTTLDKHLPAAVELLGQVLLEPRFDAADFERLKQRRLVGIDTRADNINLVTANVWQRLLYGELSIEGQPDAGTHETVSGMTLGDVKSFYARSVVPDGSRLVFVGDLEASAVHDLFAPLVARWKAANPTARPQAMAREASADTAGARVVHWVDRPGAAQSQVRIGHLSVSSNDPDYVPLGVLNYILGGAFSSRINMNLREDKGYTYGARSSFSGGLEPGPFAASAGVHTAVTGESVKEFMRELNGILEGVTDAELAFAKDALTQQMATRFESSRALLGMLDNVAKFGWPDDYLEQRLRVIDALTTEDLRHLAKQYIRPEKAVVLVVGDGEQIAEQLGALDLGPLEELDIDGRSGRGR